MSKKKTTFKKDLDIISISIAHSIFRENLNQIYSEVDYPHIFYEFIFYINEELKNMGTKCRISYWEGDGGPSFITYTNEQLNDKAFMDEELIKEERTISECLPTNGFDDVDFDMRKEANSVIENWKFSSYLLEKVIINLIDIHDSKNEEQEKIQDSMPDINAALGLVWCSVCEGNSHDEEDCPLIY